MNFFVVNSKLPSLNEYINACRTNPFGGAKFKRDVEKKIGIAIDNYLEHGNLVPTDNPVKVSFTWSEKTKRRDADNIASAKKYILDAMQTHKIIPNDNRNYVKGFFDDIIDGEEDYVVVEIKPIEDISETKKILPGIFWI